MRNITKYQRKTLEARRVIHARRDVWNHVRKVDDRGDFDDFGSGYDGSYHYENKRKLGRF